MKKRPQGALKDGQAGSYANEDLWCIYGIDIYVSSKEIQFENFEFRTIIMANVKLGLNIYQGLTNHRFGKMSWQY